MPSLLDFNVFKRSYDGAKENQRIHLTSISLMSRCVAIQTLKRLANDRNTTAPARLPGSKALRFASGHWCCFGPCGLFAAWDSGAEWASKPIDRSGARPDVRSRPRITLGAVAQKRCYCAGPMCIWRRRRPDSSPTASCTARSRIPILRFAKVRCMNLSALAHRKKSMFVRQAAYGLSA